MSYAVILHDYPDLSERSRRTAERRFEQALEAALGGPGGVLLAWHAWQRAEHSSAGISVSEWHIARRWVLAVDRARGAGLADLRDLPDAVFEVRPELP